MAQIGTTPSLTIGEPTGQVATYKERTAVRCFIIKDSNICIIHVKNGNYYKLPGGGVDPEDEGNHQVAVKREALEETGCEVEVLGEVVAHTLEWREPIKQDSYAYVCKVVKDTGKIALTEDEIKAGLEHEWCSVSEALQKMKVIEPTNMVGRFRKERDVFLLEEFVKKCGLVVPSLRGGHR
ncbi:Putative NUDIX hydrolase domain-containing protein [Septoria linicola]|uniref:NUDIX hydrolase domain-containing protein n=1 Tax=Septoria linicola TaxID=215465 RepID=A0A9Q9AYL0_9PEZI|nr:putative NUDIX hydrolase domain-containing protein [Septoria linicola]USW53021.1 Putative NUDIX hydrolase domain-containing protein [Septoria linicola]